MEDYAYTKCAAARCQEENSAIKNPEWGDNRGEEFDCGRKRCHGCGVLAVRGGVLLHFNLLCHTAKVKHK